jgi:hypothetical protein
MVVKPHDGPQTSKNDKAQLDYIIRTEMITEVTGTESTFTYWSKPASSFKLFVALQLDQRPV